MGTRETPDEERGWRSETDLSLEELDRAVATSSTSGQGDDATGGDAGAEETFGHGDWPATEPGARPASEDDDEVRERRMRPSPEGRIGPS